MAAFLGWPMGTNILSPISSKVGGMAAAWLDIRIIGKELQKKWGCLHPTPRHSALISLEWGLDTELFLKPHRWFQWAVVFANHCSKIGEGNGTPLQYSCLENPMDGGAWEAAVHGVAKSWTRLSDFTFTFHFPALEREMATHSSVLAWRIPGMGEPGGLPSMGSHRVGHDWSDLAAVAAAAPRYGLPRWHSGKESVCQCRRCRRLWFNL